MTVIDSHGHAWTEDHTYEWNDEVTPAGVEKVVYTVENYREDLDTLGVDEAVLVATPIHGNGSPYTLDCLRTYPDTFHGVVLLDYSAEDIANQVAEAMAIENLIGVRLMHNELYEANPNLWSALAEHDGQAQFLVDPPALSEIESLAADHPGVQFVVDHLGMASGIDDQAPEDAPYTTMADLATHSNVVVKLTHTPSAGPYPFEDVHEHIRYLLETFGSDRLLWGSDYIYHLKKTSVIDTKRFLDELPFLSTGDRRRILGRNMANLLY